MEIEKFYEEVLQAEKRIGNNIVKTPLEFSPYLSQGSDCQVYLKTENYQLTGSFKLRGAMNKFLSLSQEEIKRGIVTASSGNHAAAFAYLIKNFNCQGTIFLPENVSKTKAEALASYEAELKFYGNDCVIAEMKAKEYAKENGKTFISPYNDLQIIGGQGTIGIELEQQLKDIDVVLVPVGGGGLISGISVYLKSINNNIKIIGCLPKNSAVMYESVKAGKILEMESKPTVSDGSAGGIEPGSVTFDICRDLVDDYILLDEEEIKSAIGLILRKHFMLIEGAGALSTGAFIKEKSKFRNKNVVLLISGNKLNLSLLKDILSHQSC